MNHNIVVVFDEHSRLNITINLTELIYKDVKIIASLSELTEEQIISENCVVFLLDRFFVNEGSYSEVLLLKHMYNIDFVYLGLDVMWLEVASTVCRSYKIDASSLNYELLSSIIYEDVNLLSKLQSTFQDSDEGNKLSEIILSSKTETDNAKLLARYYQSLHDINLSLVRYKTQMMEQYNIMSTKFNHIEEDNKGLYNGYVSLIKESTRVNGILKQYEVALQKDFYDKVDISKYKNRPVVLYLKEYEELLFFSSFIDTLFNMIYYQNKLPVKVLLLADSSFSKRLLKLPSKCHIVHDSYTKGELVENDFIVKIGNYDKVLDLLLTNEVRLGCLIVIDCKDNTDTVMLGSFIRFNLCRNLARCENYSIDKDNTICSNDAEHELSWNYYPEYNKLGEDHDRFLFLSSRSVMQYIYRVIEIYKDSI